MKFFLIFVLMINVQEIIDKYSLDGKVVAELLFPDNKYPVPALKRVIIGEMNLDSDQLHKLASLAGVTVSELYNNDWEFIRGETNTITFIAANGSYRAILDLNTWVTRIFDTESLFHESIIHGGAISLGEYLNKLDSIIKKVRQCSK